MQPYLNTKKLAVLGLLAALAYISLLFIRIPIIPSATFLRYDIKDVIITIGGFLYGPLYGLILAIIVSFLQMLTASEYGLIGFTMNLLSTASFVCAASAIYKYKKDYWGALKGLALGCVSMTVIMLLWNYIVTPMYMGVTRDVVKDMLLPVFLPFNLIKSVLNAGISMVLYKNLTKKLHKLDMKSDS